VLAFLEEERLKGGEWDPLRRLVERQWERMGEARRRRVEQLVWRTVRGGPLGEHLAGALWGVRPEVARHLLRDLERTGLVERVTVHPLEWGREGKVEMWRVTPVVFHLRREAGEQSAQEKELQALETEGRLPEGLGRPLRHPADALVPGPGGYPLPLAGHPPEGLHLVLGSSRRLARPEKRLDREVGTMDNHLDPHLQPALASEEERGLDGGGTGVAHRPGQ